MSVIYTKLKETEIASRPIVNTVAPRSKKKGYTKRLSVVDGIKDIDKQGVMVRRRTGGGVTILGG